jgi:hypothetical protein
MSCFLIYCALPGEASWLNSSDQLRSISSSPRRPFRRHPFRQPRGGHPKGSGVKPPPMSQPWRLTATRTVWLRPGGAPQLSRLTAELMGGVGPMAASGGRPRGERDAEDLIRAHLLGHVQRPWSSQGQLQASSTTRQRPALLSTRVLGLGLASARHDNPVVDSGEGSLQVAGTFISGRTSSSSRAGLSEPHHPPVTQSGRLRELPVDAPD